MAVSYKHIHRLVDRYRIGSNTTIVFSLVHNKSITMATLRFAFFQCKDLKTDINQKILISCLCFNCLRWKHPILFWTLDRLCGQFLLWHGIVSADNYCSQSSVDKHKENCWLVQQLTDYLNCYAKLFLILKKIIWPLVAIKRKINNHKKTKTQRKK